MRPDVVLYEEPLDGDVMYRRMAISKADLVIVGERRWWCIRLPGC